MTTTEKISELAEKELAEQTIAQKRAASLFDEGSFIEMGGLKNSAGVVTGYGTINGRLAFVYSQNSPVGAAHASKIARIYEMALKMGAPVVGIMDSKGLYLDEGIAAFDAYGSIFSVQSDASGVIPQISVIVGECIGTAAISPMLSDYVIMTDKKARMFLTSPATFEGIDAKNVSYDDLGGAKVLAKKSGFIDFEAEDEVSAIEIAKKLIGFLPSNNLEEAADAPTDDLNREDPSLNGIVGSENDLIDVHAVIKSIADNGDFLETKKYYAKEVVTGFIKLGGATTGIVANKGKLTIDSLEKAALFVNGCDCFNIPILTLTDVESYDDGVTVEQKGLLKNSAKLLYAFKNASVPKVNLIMRNAVGNGYVVMNSRHTGCDFIIAWPSAKVALMQKKAAVNIMGVSPDKYDEHSTAYHVMDKGYIDDIIKPEYTRKRLISAFEMLSSKRVGAAGKKHGSVQY